MLFNCCKATLGMRIHCLQRNFSAPPLVHVQAPSPAETHLWYILPGEVKSASLLDQYYQHLSPCEKEDISSMGTDQLKKSALLARTLVRTTIARWKQDMLTRGQQTTVHGYINYVWILGLVYQVIIPINSEITPSSLKFRKTVYGKPEVDWKLDDKQNRVPLHFNLSHTSSLIACGVTSDSPIGIDVEEIQRRLKHNILAFARRYFTHDEVEYLSAISDCEAQKRELLKMWTIKESYVKALGMGFSGAPFKTFNIQYINNRKGGRDTNSDFDSVLEIMVKPMNSDDVNITSNWQFKLLELASSHYASICTEKNKVEGKSLQRKLTVWKTVPFVEDECVSGTSEVIEIL